MVKNKIIKIIFSILLLILLIMVCKLNKQNMNKQDDLLYIYKYDNTTCEYVIYTKNNREVIRNKSLNEIKKFLENPNYNPNGMSNIVEIEE